MASKKQPIRHVPQRTCVACREVKAKQELIRLVPAANGGVEIDPTGKKAGRGAYLCKVRDCWEIGLRMKRLEQRLHTQITPKRREELVEFGKSLSPRDVVS